MLEQEELLQGGHHLHGVGGPYLGQEEEGLDREQQTYRSLFNLITHTDQSMGQAQSQEAVTEVQEKHTVLTIMFLSLLESSGWLEQHSTKGWSKQKEVVASQLFHLLAVVKFNTHQTGQFDSFCLRTGYTASSVGQAVRPALAMANHSCNPNMVRADRGRCCSCSYSCTFPCSFPSPAGG